MKCRMVEVARRVIKDRLKQHRENLDAWKEVVRCHCRHSVFGANPHCVYCGGAGDKAAPGYLVPTEPDGDKRARIRHDLKIAISELEFIQQELGL